MGKDWVSPELRSHAVDGYATHFLKCPLGDGEASRSNRRISRGGHGTVLVHMNKRSRRVTITSNP
jgi:hypothetical protein